MKIPNIIHDSVPVGKDDKENVVVEVIGEPKIPDYEILNHVELAEKKLWVARYRQFEKDVGARLLFFKGRFSKTYIQRLFRSPGIL
jgi:seryl-tRNA synthetase